nr:MAG TPA: hypothetical protein [Bacteriophage sp.]
MMRYGWRGEASWVLSCFGWHGMPKSKTGGCT